MKITNQTKLPFINVIIVLFSELKTIREAKRKIIQQKEKIGAQMSSILKGQDSKSTMIKLRHADMHIVDECTSSKQRLMLCVKVYLSRADRKLTQKPKNYDVFLHC